VLLRPDEGLLRETGAGALVARVDREAERQTVYNFEVARTHTYFVGGAGVLVHNPSVAPGQRVKVRVPPGVIPSLPNGGVVQGLAVANAGPGQYRVEVNVNGTIASVQASTATRLPIPAKGQLPLTATNYFPPPPKPAQAGGALANGWVVHPPIAPGGPSPFPGFATPGTIVVAPAGLVPPPGVHGPLGAGGIVIGPNPQSNPNYQQQVLNDLNKISTTPSGQALLDSIANSHHSVRIDYGDGFVLRPNTSAQPGGNAALNYNPGIDGMAVQPMNGDPNTTRISDGVIAPVMSGQGGNWTWASNKPSDTTLYHELVHANAHVTGTFPPGDVPGTNVANGEWQAVGLGPWLNDPISENAYRQDLGLPPRPFYGTNGEWNAMPNGAPPFNPNPGMAQATGICAVQ
jgi:hypothetical protein